MQDLLRTQSDGRNAPRNFWLWVDKQPWRRMLPMPLEFLEALLNLYSFFRPIDQLATKGEHSAQRSVCEGAVPHGILAYLPAI